MSLMDERALAASKHPPMKLWRVERFRPPEGRERKGITNDYAVMAATSEDAIALAVTEAEPGARGQWSAKEASSPVVFIRGGLRSP